MVFRVTVEQSITPPSGKIGWKETKEADGLTEVAPIVPDASANFLVEFVANLSAAEAIWFYSDVEITIFTNDLSSGTPADTIVVPAGVAIVWAKGGQCANKVTADITALYVTNASGGDANCKFGVLQDVSQPA